MVVQFGGQTALNLAEGLKRAGAPILGTPPESIHLAEDRDEFQKILRALGLRQPENGIARNADEARVIAARIGYPVLIRPSYVLGGRAMELCNNEQDLLRYIAPAFAATDRTGASGSADDPGGQVPARRDRDRRRRGRRLPPARRRRRRGVICGVMEHIEQAGIHSGDSSCCIPPHSLSPQLLEEMRRQTRLMAKAIGVCGLMNVQFAVAGGEIYVLEVNPRASRTVPFVSKATGVPWAKVATAVMLGRSLRDVVWEFGASRSPRALMTADQGAGVPVPQVPRSRRGARPGDAQHRRGHGHRGDVSASRTPRRRSPSTPVAAHRRQRARQRQRP